MNVVKSLAVEAVRGGGRGGFMWRYMQRDEASCTDNLFHFHLLKDTSILKSNTYT